jgi:uncharacterized protein YjiS (DUF1127 family)
MSTFPMSRLIDPLGQVLIVASEYASALAARRRRRVTYLALSSLDDHALRDIGLNRTMLLSVATHAAASAEDEPAMVPRRPRVLMRLINLISEARERIGDEEIRRFERRLGPNQVKEMVGRALGSSLREPSISQPGV